MAPPLNLDKAIPNHEFKMKSSSWTYDIGIIQQGPNNSRKRQNDITPASVTETLWILTTEMENTLISEGATA
ncbi:unnamed protein product [Absidia cylindrospora]